MEYRINEDIDHRNVRLIGTEGEQLGVRGIAEALSIAYETGMDLVEISPNASPPVCKIMDFGKYKYTETKKKQEAKKRQTAPKTKEIRVRPGIGKHDLGIKIAQIKDFLSEGHRVKVGCFFKGREISLKAIGENVVNEVLNHTMDVADHEYPSKAEGRSISVVLIPK